MKSLVSFTFSILISICPALADKQYAENGFSFTYPDAMEVNSIGTNIKTIIIKDEAGSQVTLQNFGATITPDKISDTMVKTLLQRFENQSEIVTHKGITRTLFGEERKGTYLLLTPNDIPIECAVFTFSVDGNTICVITQFATQFCSKAESYFKTIQASLKLAE